VSDDTIELLARMARQQAALQDAARRSAALQVELDRIGTELRAVGEKLADEEAGR
jgi:uncharacterized coiled-coil protein SlyX